MVSARGPRNSSDPAMPTRPSMLRRMVRPRWVDLVPRVLGAREQVLPPQQARDWALVLAAAKLPHRITYQGPVCRVQVQGWALRQAEGEITAWLAENQERPASPAAPLPVVPSRLWPTVGAMLVLVLLHFLALADYPQWGLYAHDFSDLGSAWAQSIRQGEWWRLITALTLHGDGAHVVGNAVIGGVFLVLAARRLGSGLAWTLVLASGVAGNWINALVAAPTHDSVGFSTAVFGAAGLLAGLRVADRIVDGKSMDGMGWGGRLAELLIPLGAGLGILAMLGSGGENTDLGAHLFGLGAGVLLGMGVGPVIHRTGAPSAPWQAALGVACAGMVALAWGLALA